LPRAGQRRATGRPGSPESLTHQWRSLCRKYIDVVDSDMYFVPIFSADFRGLLIPQTLW